MNQRTYSKENTFVNHKSRPNYKTNSKYVNVAPNFYGYIRGIQYYNNLQINKDAEYFTDTASSNRSLLFYYKFDKENEVSGNFSNLATYSDYFNQQDAVFNDTIIETSPQDESMIVFRKRIPQYLFDRVPFKDFYEKFNTGELTHDISWDGLTCN